jgi:hypothetical protein
MPLTPSWEDGVVLCRDCVEIVRFQDATLIDRDFCPKRGKWEVGSEVSPRSRSVQPPDSDISPVSEDPCAGTRSRAEEKEKERARSCPSGGPVEAVEETTGLEMMGLETTGSLVMMVLA